MNICFEKKKKLKFGDKKKVLYDKFICKFSPIQRHKRNILVYKDINVKPTTKITVEEDGQSI
jgi:hypothetical protein